MRVHLIGAGDFDIDRIAAIEDPCPLPDKSNPNATKRTLKSKDTLLYAPMANVGRLQMDRDGVYIEIRDVHYTKPDQLFLGEERVSGTSDLDLSEDTPAGLLRSMQDVDFGVDEKLGSSELKLFKQSAALTSEQAKRLIPDSSSKIDDQGVDEVEVEDNNSFSSQAHGCRLPLRLMRTLSLTAKSMTTIMMRKLALMRPMMRMKDPGMMT